MYWSQQDLQVYSFDKVRGDLVVWDRHNPDVTPTFLQHYCLFFYSLFFWFYFLLLGKKPPWPPCSLCSTRFFAFRLHQSSSPSSSNMHAIPWSLVSLQFACENNAKLFFPPPSLLFFLSLLRLSRKPFFNPFFPPNSLREKKREKIVKEKKKKFWERWTEHGSGCWWVNDLTDVVS